MPKLPSIPPPSKDDTLERPLHDIALLPEAHCQRSAPLFAEFGLGKLVDLIHGNQARRAAEGVAEDNDGQQRGTFCLSARRRKAGQRQQQACVDQSPEGSAQHQHRQQVQ